MLFVEGAGKVLQTWLERKVGVVLGREAYRSTKEGELARREYAQCRYHLITRACRNAQGGAMTQLRILLAKDFKESPQDAFNHWIGDFSRFQRLPKTLLKARVTSASC